MHDLSDLIAWAEKKYQIQCPPILWVASRLNSRSGEQDGIYIEEDGGFILLWSGTENPEFLFLHEYWHHIYAVEGIPDPVENENRIDKHAKIDLFHYHVKQTADFEEKLIEEEKDVHTVYVSSTGT